MNTLDGLDARRVTEVTGKVLRDLVEVLFAPVVAGTEGLRDTMDTTIRFLHPLFPSIQSKLSLGPLVLLEGGDSGSGTN